MVQNTARLILCLLAGHVFMVSASYNECEPKEFARCVQVFHRVFQNAERSQNMIDVYCDAYKEVSYCATSNADCVGNIMDLYRFVTLQHMIVDSKQGICPKNDLTHLRKLVHAIEEYRTKFAAFNDLDADKFKPCTAKKNLYCISRLAEEIRNGGEICRSFTNFYLCYESKAITCDDKLYKDYVANIKTAGEELVQIAKEFPNLFKC